MSLEKAFIQKGLSQREADVALAVSKGKSNKDVASQLFVTEKTIKFHLTNIYKKLGLKSRSQLIVWAMPHMSFSETKSDEIIEKPKSKSDWDLPSGV